MTGLNALLKKELKEQFKTYRLLIIAGVFLFFGLSTPLMLKYLPELIKLAGEDIVIDLPPPTALQALGEYTDTVVQVDALAFLGSNLLLALFFILCLAVTLLFSSLFKNHLAAGGVALAALIGQTVMAQLPWIGEYTPGSLISWGSRLLSGDALSAWGAVVVSLAVVVACLSLSRLVLKRKEI